MVIESPICMLSSDAELVSAAHALATDSSNMMASVGTITQHRNTHTHTIYSTERIVESEQVLQSASLQCPKHICVVNNTSNCVLYHVI